MTIPSGPIVVHLLRGSSRIAWEIDPIWGIPWWIRLPTSKIELGRVKCTAYKSCIFSIQFNNCSIVACQGEGQLLYCTGVHSRSCTIFWQQLPELDPSKSLTPALSIFTCSMILIRCTRDETSIIQLQPEGQGRLLSNPTVTSLYKSLKYFHKL